MSIETKNAIIESTSLSTSDHGVLIGYLHLDYGGSGQGFGGITLYLPKSFTHYNILSPAGHWIYRVMEIAGVEKWGDLPGKTVRVKAENFKVHAIGHIVKDDWFNPVEDFANINEESK